MSITPSAPPNEDADHAGRWRLAQSGDRAIAAKALWELAARFWYPVYAWWRATGLGADEAAAAAEACFTCWAEYELPSVEDAGVMRLREWMLARLAQAAERGIEPAANPFLAIDRALAAQRFAREQLLEPGALFQRRWALVILEDTIAALHAEYVAAGKGAMVPLLLPTLGFSSNGGEKSVQSARAAKITEGAFRVAVFEYRKRYRELLRAQVADTVADAAEIGDELTALLCASS